jgi:SART-1 family
MCTRRVIPQSYQTKDLEDLAGIRVGHHIEAIEEGDNVILTLKDRGVLDEGEGNAETEFW